jgi:hypothetical protein
LAAGIIARRTKRVLNKTGRVEMAVVTSPPKAFSGRIRLTKPSDDSTIPCGGLPCIVRPPACVPEFLINVSTSSESIAREANRSSNPAIGKPVLTSSVQTRK